MHLSHFLTKIDFFEGVEGLHFLNGFFRNNKSIMNKKVFEKIIKDGDPSLKFIEKKRQSQANGGIVDH